MKRQINIILLVWGLFSFVGILVTFQKGNRLEKKHVKIIELADNVKSEFFQSQVHQRNFFLSGDTALFTPLIKNLDAAEEYLSEIISISQINIERVDSTSKNNFVLHVIKMQEYLVKIEEIFETWPLQNKDSSEQYLNIILLEYNKYFREFENGLQKYLSEESLSYKRTASILVIGAFTILIVSFIFISRLMNVLKATERRLVEKTVETEQKERNRIAADLHDGLGSLLSSIHLYIKILEVEIKEGKDVTEHIDHLRQLSDLSLQNVKTVIGNLEPLFLSKHGLITSVEKMCMRMNKLDVIHIEFSSEKFSVRLSRNTGLIVYRIISELLNNALKHSRAKNVNIHLESIRNKIFIYYSDDGVGFDWLGETINKEGKIGLKSIINRIELLGGSYDIQTSKGEGLSVKLWFWLNKRNQGNGENEE